MSRKSRPQQPPAAGILPWTLAATSFLWPATVRENCAGLEGHVDEVCILFFETGSSLSYTEEDLPPQLAELDLAYHLHLPLDLDWEAGPERVFSTVRQLIAKISFLRPRCFVLHPPRDPDALAGLLRLWRAEGWEEELLYLENIKGNDLVRLWPLIRSTRCRVCLDLGHLLEYEQEQLLELPGLQERIGMLHLYAPCGGRHVSLSRLSPAGRDLLFSLLHRLSRDAVIVLEVFSWPEFQDSLDIFTTWIRKWEIGSRRSDSNSPLSQ